jgi:hypothetical protein
MREWSAENVTESVTEWTTDVELWDGGEIDNGGFRMMAFEYPDAFGVWLKEAHSQYDVFDYIINTMTVELVNNVPTLNFYQN